MRLNLYVYAYRGLEATIWYTGDYWYGTEDSLGLGCSGPTKEEAEVSFRFTADGALRGSK